MQNKYSTFHALGHAVLAVLYIASIAWLLFNGEGIFGPDTTFLVPMAILLLFVLSATVVGGLVLGRPALLYFNGQKTEALQFLGYTIMWVFIITLIVFSYLALGK